MDREVRLEAAIQKAARIFKRRGGREDLEDYLQTCRLVRLELAKKLVSLSDDNAGAYLFRACIHKMNDDEFRKGAVRTGSVKAAPFRDGKEKLVPDRDGYDDYRERQRRIVMALLPRVCRYPNKTRAVVVTATLQGYSPSEIARRLGITPTSVCGVRDRFIRKALKKLGLDQ